MERVCLCDKRWRTKVAEAVEREGEVLRHTLDAEELSLVDIHINNIAIGGTWEAPTALFIDVESLTKYGPVQMPTFKVGSVTFANKGTVDGSVDRDSIKRVSTKIRQGPHGYEVAAHRSQTSFNVPLGVS